MGTPAVTPDKPFEEKKWKLADRKIDTELLPYLALESDKDFELPGSFGPNLLLNDPRLHDKSISISGVGKIDLSRVCYYRHVATLRDTRTDTFYVAFRETVDALYARSEDLKKYPKWLMESELKQRERKIFVYRVTATPTATMSNLYDWLVPFDDTPAADAIFETVVYYLAQKGIIDEATYSKMGK